MKIDILRSASRVAMVSMAFLLGASASYAAPKMARYAVTITNLTNGQPLTPPVVATHRRPLHVFQVGEAASPELQEIAENGRVTPLFDALSANKQVFEAKLVVSPSGPPPILPGGAVTFDISAARGAKQLSFASMLICTNDGFTGIDALRLPKKVGDAVTIQSIGYDAGTEINTEDFADIVPPCQGLIGVMSDDDGTDVSNPDLAEGGVIAVHSNILGGVDLLPEVHGWIDPVAEIVIIRTE